MKPKTVGRVLTRKGAVAHKPPSPSGVVAGTLILTADGALPVEFLSAGDRIISRARGMVRVTDVSASTQSIHMVRLETGALDENKPERPTMLPAAQPVLLRGSRARTFGQGSQVVMPAGCIVDDLTVTDLGERDVRLFHLTFPQPELIYADGLELVFGSVAMSGSRAA